ERQHASWRLHELLVRHTAHRALVHAHGLGYLAQRERAQVLNAALEEITLPVHDEVHDLEHGLTPLLDGLDHPVGGVELAGNEVLALAVKMLAVARQLLIGAAELEARQVAI